MAKFKPIYEYVCEVKVEATYEVTLQAQSWDDADRVIDIACGREMSWKRYLLDNVITNAQEGPRLTDSSVFGIITSTTEPPEVFDAREKKKALAEARRLLDQEGFLVVGDPECYEPMTEDQAEAISDFAQEVLT